MGDKQAYDCHRFSFVEYMVAWGRTWKAFLAAVIKRLSFEWIEAEQSYTCFVCGELVNKDCASPFKDCDLYKHVLFGCPNVKLLMLYYQDKHPYTFEPEMENYILTVPVGSYILKSLEYVCACFHSWQKKYERLYQRQFYIPYNFFTDEASLRVNAHLTHYAVKKRWCLEMFKEGAKQRRKLKRQCEAEISNARTRGDASSLWTALDVQEYTHVEKARKLDACSDLKDEVTEYAETHVLL